jgi:hypothetical protein
MVLTPEQSADLNYALRFTFLNDNYWGKKKCSAQPAARRIVELPISEASHCKQMR